MEVAWHQKVLNVVSQTGVLDDGPEEENQAVTSLLKWLDKTL